MVKPAEILNKSRIARKLVLAIVLFSSAITIITTGIQLYLDYRHDVSRIYSDLDLIETSQMQSLINSLWLYDEYQIKTQLDGLLRFQDVEYLEVDAGKDHVWSAGEKTSKYKIVKKLDLLQSYRGKKYKLGTLQIQASLDEVWRRLFNKFLVILVSNGIKTFLVAGFILLIFQGLVTRHLKTMARHFEGLDFDQPDAPLRLNRKKRPEQPDELDGLVRAINDMQGKITWYLGQRKDAENALKKREKQYRRLMETANDAIFIAQDGKIKVPNPKMLDLLGYSEDELAFKPFSEWLHPDDRQMVLDRYTRRLDGEHPPSTYSFRALNRNGDVLWVQLSTALTTWEDRPATLNFLRDITEQKLAEERARESRRRLQTIFDSLDSDVYVSDLATFEVLYVNKHIKESFGEGLIGSLCYRVFRQKEKPCDHCPLPKLLTDGLPGTPIVTEEFNPVVGRWYHNQDQAITWVDGRLVHLHMATDITEQKNAAQEWVRLSMLVENSHEFIGLADLEGRVLYINPAGLRMVGLESQEKAVELKIIDFLPAEDRETLNGRILPILISHGAWSGEYQLHHFLTERPIPVDVNLFLVMDSESGEPSCMAAVIRDMTERNKAEMERERLENQLRHSQKMQAIGTLAGGIAHDFNNILAAIIGYNELALMDTPPESPIAECLSQSIKAGQRAKHLIQQILAFSRNTRHEKSIVDLSQIVKETVKFLRASLPSTIDIRQDVNTDSNLVEADPTQIHQVIMNLGTNAGQAMREKGGVLTIRLGKAVIDESSDLTREISAGEYLKLSISDTGPGIDPDIIDRIFDPFFTTKETGQGTGMGLAVVHGIVRNHGGVVIVNSVLGQGSVFDIYLPLSKAEADEAIVSDSEAVPLGSERILFVDDEDTLVNVGRSMLERLGYRVETRTDSREALALIQTSPGGFDLIITDQTMPHLTGAELAQEIRKIQPDLPIILCTGYSNSLTAEQAGEMGFTAFMMKPIVFQDMAAAIRKVLD